MFRTSPLRNIALQPAFFHNGSFTLLKDAVRHHLDVFASARNYDPVRAAIAEDLRNRSGPIEPVLSQIDPLLATPIRLSDDEFQCLVDFVREGLLDTRAEPAHFRKLVPQFLPSGRPPLQFQFENLRP